MISAPDTIPRTVRAAAATHGDATAIEDGEVRLSFRELDAARVRAARAFIAAGVTPGDRAAIWAPNVYEWIVAALGLHSAGGVLVPLNTRFKGAEAGYVLARSRCKLLLGVAEFLGTRYLDVLRDANGGASASRPVAGLPALERVVMLRGGAPEGSESWRAFLAGGETVSASEAEARADAVGEADLSDLLFTSGTTGQPKGVMTTHAQNLRTFRGWSETAGLRAGDRYLIVNPFFHAFGYKAGWLSAILQGATILPQQVFDVPAVLERIARDHVTVLPGPPTLYQSLLAHPDRGKFDLSSLRLAVTGAAVVPTELVRRMKSELGFAAVLTAYGLTETCGVVSMCRHDDDLETIAKTSGRAIDGVHVRIVGDDGAERARGEAGEIVVRGFNVMRGYFEDDAETSATIDADGFLHTGDIGVLDERGYLTITDRKKDLFIVGGFNCYPAEIENLMLRHAEIAEVAVIGIPDERLGEVGMAFVVAKPGASLSPNDVATWCREQMANFKVPRRVELVTALPRNATGKVQKFVLRERARGA